MPEAIYLWKRIKTNTCVWISVCAGTHTSAHSHKLMHAHTKGQIFKLKPMYMYLLGKWSTKNKGKMSLS